MDGVYNYFLAGYSSTLSPRDSVHKEYDLKKTYHNIIKINQKSPLSLVQLSDDKQKYALDIKDISMELYANAKRALNDEDGATKETLSNLEQLITRSDEYAESVGKSSRPGEELRRLKNEFKDELDKAPEEKPTGFLTTIMYKAENMAMNPMEYVDHKIFSYENLSGKYFGSAYAGSMYSGMLFSSYC